MIKNKEHMHARAKMHEVSAQLSKDKDAWVVSVRGIVFLVLIWFKS